MLPNNWLDLTTMSTDEINTILETAYSEDATPNREDVFRAFEMVSPEDVKVVIIGQDPYPTPGDADGLSFSTRATKTPRSLQNMFKIIKEDFGIENSSPDLTKWAEQGILLMNKHLTCRKSDANSHQHLGWDKLTNELIQQLDQRFSNIVFVAWGGSAQKIAESVTQNIVLTSSHPSPLSANRGKEPFMKSHIFKRINDTLIDLEREPIDWRT